MPNFPQPRITDSLGRQKTLAIGTESFIIFDEHQNMIAPNCAEKKILLLGLGPSFEHACHAILAYRTKDLASTGGKTTIFVVECPNFEQALRDAALAVPSEALEFTVTAPADSNFVWQRLSPDAAVELAAQDAVPVLAYRQNAQLFPDFWGPLMGRLRVPSASMRGGNISFFATPKAQMSVFLPGSPQDLLHLELTDALRAEACFPLTPPPISGIGTTLPDLARLIERERPAFFLSVNLRGLDRAGDIFYLLQALHVPVALWFVDNPWHILSALRLPWWKRATLFVSDPSFVPGLRAHGAEQVFPLPLASSPFFDASHTASFPPHIKTLFVGRSSFPDRDSFFAAHANTLHQRSQQGSPRHFHNYVEDLHITQLWPGHEVRRAGAAAERETLALRTTMLREAAALGLAVVGDNGWTPILQQFSETPLLYPPVDYYTTLPSLYRAAPYSLNATSLLLPSGLTQRHFDVWRAGGFLLSAENSGLSLFPDELTLPITFNQEHPLAERVAFWEARPTQKKELRQTWHDFILKNHSYRDRIRFMREKLR